MGLTRAVKDALTYVSCGGAPAYVWPGGARDRFDGVLAALVHELPLLRAAAPQPGLMGAVARRMHRATAPHATTPATPPLGAPSPGDFHPLSSCVRPEVAPFLKPMAEGAGAVADEILAAVCALW